MPLAHSVPFALGALLLAACSTTERPSLSRTDAMGRPANGAPTAFRWTTEGGSLDAPAAPPAPIPVPEATHWRWSLEVGPSAGPVAPPVGGASQTLAGGLRVAVADAEPPAGRTETFLVEERQPTAVSVGWPRWPVDTFPANEAGGGHGGEAHVEWLVSLQSQGECAVALEAVPRVSGLTECPVLLEEYRIRRTLALGQALVLWSEGEEKSSRVAGALTGAREGRPAQLILRVR